MAGVTDQPRYSDSFVTLRLWIDDPAAPLSCRRFAPDLGEMSPATASGVEAIQSLATDAIARLDQLMRR